MSKPLLFDKSLQNLEVLFRYSGMNLKNKIVKPTDVIKYRWLFIFNLIWVLSAVSAVMYYIMLGIANGANFIELTSAAPCFIFAVLAIIKSIFHMKHEDDVQQLIGVLRDLEIIQNSKETCVEREEIINGETRFLNKVINVLYVLNCLMIIVFDMTPLVLMAVKYYRTNEFEMMLPYLDVFSFIPYELKYWLLAYIHQIWSECISLLNMGAADYLFFTCCTYNRVQFRLLQYDIAKITSYKGDLKDSIDVCTEDDVKGKFSELIQWHQNLIKSSNILEVIYSKSTLFNFMSSSLVICFTGFIVTIVKDIVVIITFVTFLFMALMQVFFLCFFADLLTSASLEVSNAVYNSGWYSADHGFGKQLLLMQIRSQKPSKLTAAGFTDVNLRAFMRVLSTAWSYFALLQTMYSG